jgi:hypothetical protein
MYFAVIGGFGHWFAHILFINNYFFQGLYFTVSRLLLQPAFCVMDLSFATVGFKSGRQGEL